MKKRALIVATALIALQGVLVGGWWLVERQRTRSVSDRPASVVEVHRDERIELRTPEKTLQSVAGADVNISAPGEHGVVLHFWGTWCPPCAEEIPSFLRRARAGDVPAVAVAVDDGPEELASFFGSEVPAGVVEATDVANGLNVRQLPQTVWVDAEGVARKRWVGARRWTPADWADLTGR